MRYGNQEQSKNVQKQCLFCATLANIVLFVLCCRAANSRVHFDIFVRFVELTKLMEKHAGQTTICIHIGCILSMPFQWMCLFVGW